MDDLRVKPGRYGRGGTVHFAQYSNHELAIVIIDDEGGIDAKATVNVVPYGAPRPPAGHVWLKGWEENEGIPERLEEAGVCHRTGKTFEINHVKAELAKLSEAALRQLAIDKARDGL